MATPQELGETPQGRRRIIGITGGRFSGDEDGALIYVRNRGYRHGPAAVLTRLSKGENVDPSLYYMRTTPRFETGDARYAWLNRMVCIASGARRPTAVELDVYEIQ